MAINQIILNPSAIARALGAMAFLLVLASTGGQLTKYLTGHDHVLLVRLFYVDAERNIPTFFSVLLLLFAAQLLTVITVLKNKHRDPDRSRWAILSFGFLFMAADEGFSLHEKLIVPVRGLLGDGTFGIFYYAWVIPGIAVVLVLALSFLKFLLHLPPKTRSTFLVAATLFIGGALGIELIGGRYVELHNENNLTYSMIVTVEESLEMTGVIVFIYALLKYIADNYKEVRLRFDDFDENS